MESIYNFFIKTNMALMSQQNKIDKLEAIETRFEESEKKLEKTIDKYGHIKKDLAKVTQTLDGIGFHYFVNYLQSPWRIIWSNFLAGVFRGLGILVGMTLVVAFIIWLLSQLVDFPLIGQYFKAILELIQEYIPESAYKSNVR